MGAWRLVPSGANLTSRVAYASRAKQGEKVDSLEQALATVHDLLRAERLDDAAALLRRWPASMEQVGYDNWNGGRTSMRCGLRCHLPSLFV